MSKRPEGEVGITRIRTEPMRTAGDIQAELDAEDAPTTRTEWAIRTTNTRYDGSKYVDIWPLANEEMVRDDLDFMQHTNECAEVVSRTVTEWGAA